MIPETYYGHRLNRNATEKLSKEVQALCLRTVEEFAMSDMPEQPAGEAVSNALPLGADLTVNGVEQIRGRAVIGLKARPDAEDAHGGTLGPLTPGLLYGLATGLAIVRGNQQRGEVLTEPAGKALRRDRARW